MKAREIITVALFFSFFALMLFLTGRLLMPFAAPITAAAVLAMLCYPMHLRLQRWFGPKKKALTALVSTLAVVLMGLAPAGLLIRGLLREVSLVLPMAQEETQKVQAYVNTARTEPLPGVERLPAPLQEPVNRRSVQIHARIAAMAHALLQRVAEAMQRAFRNTFTLLTNSSILLFCLFFFFRDGPAMVDAFYRLFPMPQGTRELLSRSIMSTVDGVVRGSLLTGIVQGTALTIGLMILRFPAVLFLGALTAFCSLIPVVGTAMVWVPIAIYFFFTGLAWKGWFLLGWGVFVLVGIDHLVRPLLIGRSSDLPEFWLLISMLGGIEVFGPRGTLLGPVIVGVLAAFFQVYESRFLKGEG